MHTAFAAPRRFEWVIGVLAGVGLVALAMPGRSAGDEVARRPGLIARYVADGRECRRIDARAAVLEGVAPDPRLPPGDFTVEWTGFLQVQSPGEHRLRAYAVGDVRISLDGEVLLDGRQPEPGWIESRPVQLSYGAHELLVRYEGRDTGAQLSLCWSGPQFVWEPLAARWLSHARENAPDASFERGAQLARALRCAACHELPGQPAALDAPALDRLAGNVTPEWLVDWLTGDGSEAARSKGPRDPAPRRRMPHFGLRAEQAASIAAALLAEPPRSAEQPPGAQPAALANQQDLVAGRLLFDSLGCLACHRVGRLGTTSLFDGGDLSTIADKRPAEFFERWLADPAALNARHRMPIYDLSAAERGQLAAYLSSLHAEYAARAARRPLDTSAERVAEGRSLLRQLRCNACHVLASASERPARVAFKPQPDWSASCLAVSEERSQRRPRFRLTERQQASIRAWWLAISDAPAAKAPAAARLEGGQILIERGCLRCHSRDHGKGLANILRRAAKAEPVLAESLAVLHPPSLDSVGDKLHDGALAGAITRSGEPRRPWLKVRMPRFNLSPEETQSLVRYFVAMDRLPPSEDARPPVDVVALQSVGARLVTADGFGCTSCHAIGNWSPSNVAPGARGPDLSMVGQRIRREWFDRFVRNPARTTPQMEMPAVQLPVKGILGARLDDQLAAAWEVLNLAGFDPPRPGPLRLVQAEPGRCQVLTDTFELDAAAYASAVAIGLPNQHNLLFDLAGNCLEGWWTGDLASQRTRGKSWYWQAAGTSFWPVVGAHGASELRLVLPDGAVAEPTGEPCLTELDRYEHLGEGVRFVHRLNLAAGDRQYPLTITQAFRPIEHRGQQAGGGFLRRYVIEGLPLRSRARLSVLPLADQKVSTDRQTITADVPAGVVKVSVANPWRFVDTGKLPAVELLAGSQDEELACELTYMSTLPIAPRGVPPMLERISTRAELPVVPGFEAVRLPVTDRAMPTGLAWRADGTLALTSLEGRVWLGRDTDADGLEDRLTPFADGLAAPYGLAAHGNDLDVATKSAVVRLKDADQDGRADQVQTLASGWGHTLDYHDWTVGLPSDEAGNYYVALACQEDERTAGAARLRGHVLRLVPRTPTKADPRLYALDPLAGGLRFPMGIARSSAGELFVTDNQGNFTAFNELNHVRRGARYGFVGRFELSQGMSSAGQPAAIEIPHPWTRSVNGICFLHTPSDAPTNSPGFGPFEGHLIGCEYDTRRLVRMSLEQVDDTWQGAVYPFSTLPAGGQETFEGPLVCQVSPRGDVYVGNVRDSGWGAGANTGSLVRLRPRGTLPTGIAEVRAAPHGFSIRFTGAVDGDLARQPASYSVSSYRRQATSAYGAADQDRRSETIRQVRLEDGNRQVHLELEDLRPGFVYEFQLKPLSKHGTLFPAEAYYTLRRVPR